MNQMLWLVCDSERWGFPLSGLYDGLKLIIWGLLEACLNGAFAIINGAVSYAQGNLGGSLEEYNTAIYNGSTGVIDNVVNAAFVPIAIVILSFVVLYDFISQLMEKNSFHDFDVTIIIRFFFKTAIAIFITTNAMKIVSGFFALGNWLVNKVISGSGVMENVKFGTDAVNQYFGSFDDVTLSGCVSALIPSLFIFLISLVIFVGMYVILIGRMVEIFINLSVAPVAMSTLGNREFGDTGKNYIRLILAYVLQGAFIILAVAIYVKLFSAAFTGGDGEVLDQSGGASAVITMKLFETAAYGIVLILTMFKSGNMAKSIMNAH